MRGLVGPGLARRWRVPAGTATILCAVVAGLCGAVTAFGLPSITVTLLVSGVLVDVLLVLLVPAEGRRGAFLAFGALASLVTWSPAWLPPTTTTSSRPSGVRSCAATSRW